MDPLSIILILAVVGGVAVVASKSASASQDTGPSNSGKAVQNDLGLWDIAPIEQFGSYTTSYDSYFQIASDETSIPFALLKAHAKRESNFNPKAYRSEMATTNRPPSASYGLMQILWWKNSGRFQKYGYSDDTIGDGSYLYNSDVNTKIAASIILDNWNRFKNIRDTINAYNTGVAESVHRAPNNYVDDVLNTYSELIGRQIS